MLTQENDVEIHALAKRGWNQSAISRHTGRDRKTVRKYLAAGEMPVRERASISSPTMTSESTPVTARAPALAAMTANAPAATAVAPLAIARRKRRYCWRRG